MNQDHYFSAAPSIESPLVTRHVTLRGSEYTVQTQGGVFAHDKVDKGTAVLLSKVPDPALAPGSIVVDVGCGWGPITLALSEAAPDAHVWAVDVNERARLLTRQNVAAAGLSATVYSPEDAIAELGDRKISLIWSNPPVRIGKVELHELLLTWLSRLAADGVAFLVVQKNLGADSLQSWLNQGGYDCVKRASAKGYRVLEVRPVR